MVPAPHAEAAANERMDEDKPRIIYPPPELRGKQTRDELFAPNCGIVIVDKTAGYVARMGPQFEIEMREREKNNLKFAFLNANDPYHTYYRMRLKETLEGKGPCPS